MESQWHGVLIVQQDRLRDLRRLSKRDRLFRNLQPGRNHQNGLVLVLNPNVVFGFNGTGLEESPIWFKGILNLMRFHRSCKVGPSISGTLLNSE